jgi:hypothetical protein
MDRPIMTTAFVFVGVIFGMTLPGLGQIVDRGEFVEVAKGTKLCSNLVLEKSRGTLDPERVFWLVTTNARANGTQAVIAFIRESVYDRQTGDTTIQEQTYDDSYAVRFKKDPARQEMLLMISPQDGRVEATVEVCSHKKNGN